MQNPDAAIAFTLKYLELLERHLNVMWNEDGFPVCITDWITDESIGCLKSELALLMVSDLEQDARRATIKYGDEHLQTIGFGLAPDFGQFIKLGLIYGDRVVLWDLLHSRIFANDQPNQNRKGLLAQIACNILMLKPIVDRGAFVILSHPIVWSTLAAEIDADLRKDGPAPAASLGLSIAFAAIQEGLPLHPYTLLDTSPKPTSIATADEMLRDALFSSENYMFQQCLTTLLTDARVAYLDEVRMEDFYDVVSKHTKLRRELRRYFLPSLSGLSPKQAAIEVQDQLNELIELLNKQNTAIIDYTAESVDATANFLLASVSATVLGQPLISALAALGPLAIHLSTAVRKWSDKPEKNVIVQAFRTLERAAAATQTYDPVDIEHKLCTYHGAQASSLKGLYLQFMSFHWTEHRHEFLKTLPIEVSRKLLSLLSSADLAVIVNNRQFQEDYIGDYLAYLSALDEAIYWEHLGKTFESSSGLLIYDDDAHIESMEMQDMPLKTWQQLLDSLFDVYTDEIRSREYDYPLERFPRIIRFQTENAQDATEKRSALISLALSLAQNDRTALTHLVGEAFDGKVPEWLSM